MLNNPNTPVAAAGSAEQDFDWPLAYDAEQLILHHIEAFVQGHAVARQLAQRMQAETGTDFYEWVDHLTLDPRHRGALEAAGMTENVQTAAPRGTVVMHHPKAMMPRVLLQAGGSRDGVPLTLTLKPELLLDFLACHAPSAPVEGAPGARLRRALIAQEGECRLFAVERLGYRGFCIDESPAGFVSAVREAQMLFRTRNRAFGDDAEGVRHAHAVADQVLALVPRAVACELFFAEERRFWETRNHAARVQRARQDRLGLGWGNHDHHTFRCSRRFFPDLVQFMEKLGLHKRERFYAGAQAGWGAQVMESAETGIVVFADVDLLPGEVSGDYAAQQLPETGSLGTVGLWCALHGDSFLQAGMHHLEARFDFDRLRDQLAGEGVATMKPFSDFPFLRQAFTEGERWPVNPERVARLRQRDLITDRQAETFLSDGALGSHLENLQRKGGYKGFNQQAVSHIIAATDPRLAGAVR
ncbi:MAG: hypothetical protein H7A44_04155 [Opitutaceae bacterium]|nr:hypothetical protein [Cephaloticoccus sp.]MCP5529614.1 hypothetical protein [Opitutaceae bacterium]